jgi:hypothetical protein
MTPLALTVLLVVLGTLSVVTGLMWLAVPLFVLAVAALTWTIVVFASGGPERNA